MILKHLRMFMYTLLSLLLKLSLKDKRTNGLKVGMMEYEGVISSNLYTNVPTFRHGYLVFAR